MTQKEKEVWKDVPGYEGYYQVSDLGRVKSLDRTIKLDNGVYRFYKGNILVGSITNGYSKTSLSINGIARTFKFSQLVAMAFLNHKPDGMHLVVDHIDGDKSNDALENLRIVTHRANTSVHFRGYKNKLSSKFAGVSWRKDKQKWESRIQYNKVSFNLGYFNNETDASDAYQFALSKIKEGTFQSELNNQM